MVTEPSLVNKRLRDLNAKIEELQQESTRTKAMMHSRDILVERKFKEQEREISSLKRRNSDSSKATGSLPKLPRRTEKSNKSVTLKQKAPVMTIQEESTVSQTVEALTTPAVSQPINLTVEEVLNVEKDLEDSSSAGKH